MQALKEAEEKNKMIALNTKLTSSNKDFIDSVNSNLLLLQSEFEQLDQSKKKVEVDLTQVSKTLLHLEAVLTELKEDMSKMAERETKNEARMKAMRDRLNKVEKNNVNFNKDVNLNKEEKEKDGRANVDSAGI